MSLASGLAVTHGARADVVADATPDRRYVAAVAAMRALDNPPYVTYRIGFDASGAGVVVSQDDADVVVGAVIGARVPPKPVYTVAFRSGDREVDVRTARGERLIGSGSRVLDPTWGGAYDVLRYGLGGRARPSPSPAPADAAPGAEVPAPRTIASVTVLSALFYGFHDVGPATCPSGTAGHALTLYALREPKAHPLTGATIDDVTGRFCSMRFNLTENGVAGYTGDYTLNFAAVGSSWLVTDGVATLTVRVFGIAAHTVVVRWAFSDVATPANLAPDVFVSPTPSPPASRLPLPSPSPSPPPSGVPTR